MSHLFTLLNVFINQIEHCRRCVTHKKVREKCIQCVISNVNVSVTSKDIINDMRFLIDLEIFYFFFVFILCVRSNAFLLFVDFDTKEGQKIGKFDEWTQEILLYCILDKIFIAIHCFLCVWIVVTSKHSCNNESDGQWLVE